MGGNGLWPELAPFLLTAGTAPAHSPAAKCGPGVNQRLKTMPPVGFNITTAALKENLAVRTVKPKLHRERVRLFGRSTTRDTVTIFASPKATAVMVGRDDPPHDVIPYVGGARRLGRARMCRERGRPMRPPDDAARQAACARCGNGRCPVRCRSSHGPAAAPPPVSSRCR